MNLSSDHYFSASPASPEKSQRITVSLAGREVQLDTAGGVFSPDHLDRGTEVLLKHAPPAESGPVLDIGCGWGPIALSAALDLEAEPVWAIDVNERARDLTQRNAAALGLDNVTVCAPEAVPEGLRFAEIRSNPPIRVGKDALHEILGEWLPRLVTGGFAYLVVGKHLGAESLQRWIAETFPFLSVERYAREKGFHVICAERVDD